MGAAVPMAGLRGQKRRADSERMSSVREFLQSDLARQIGTGLIGAAVLFAGFMVWYELRPGPGVGDSRYRWFVDAETGVAFQHELKVGDTFPIVSPDTGNRTGYLA